MKKRISLSIAIVLIVSLVAACKKELPIEMNSKNITTRTNEIAQLLIDDNFDAAYKYFNDDIKQSLSINDLGEAWGSASSGIGECQGIESILSLYDQGRNAGYAFIKYDDKILRLFVDYDDEMKVSSINLNYQVEMPELQSTNKYTEQAVLVGENPQLNGILTIPVGVDNPPVAILIQGSGPNDMNETTGVNKPFEDLAHGLAELGIASLRYDKRFYAYPELAANYDITVDDEYLYDIASAIHMLEDYPVDPFSIYYIGHSQGGLIGYAVAFNHPELKGIILLAGTPRRMDEVMVDQISKMDGASEAQIQQYQNASDQIGQLTADSEVTMIMGIPSSYWYHLNTLAASNYIDDVTMPVLILQGESDFQVYMDPDYKLWGELTKGKDNVTMKSYPDLNHIFNTSVYGNQEDYNVEGEVSKEVIQDIADWINGKDILKDTKKDKK